MAFSYFLSAFEEYSIVKGTSSFTARRRSLMIRRAKDDDQRSIKPEKPWIA